MSADADGSGLVLDSDDWSDSDGGGSLAPAAVSAYVGGAPGSALLTGAPVIDGRLDATAAVATDADAAATPAATAAAAAADDDPDADWFLDVPGGASVAAPAWAAAEEGAEVSVHVAHQLTGSFHTLSARAYARQRNSAAATARSKAAVGRALASTGGASTARGGGGDDGAPRAAAALVRTARALATAVRVAGFVAAALLAGASVQRAASVAGFANEATLLREEAGHASASARLLLVLAAVATLGAAHRLVDGREGLSHRHRGAGAGGGTGGRSGVRRSGGGNSGAAGGDDDGDDIALRGAGSGADHGDHGQTSEPRAGAGGGGICGARPQLSIDFCRAVACAAALLAAAFAAALPAETRARADAAPAGTDWAAAALAETGFSERVAAWRGWTAALAVGATASFALALAATMGALAAGDRQATALRTAQRDAAERTAEATRLRGENLHLLSTQELRELAQEQATAHAALQRALAVRAT